MLTMQKKKEKKVKCLCEGSVPTQWTYSMMYHANTVVPYHEVYQSTMVFPFDTITDSTIEITWYFFVQYKKHALYYKKNCNFYRKKN